MTVTPCNPFKRQRLGKTTGWQHRFFDLTILFPIWLGTYEYMKSILENLFFRFETGLLGSYNPLLPIVIIRTANVPQIKQTNKLKAQTNPLIQQTNKQTESTN